MSRVKKILDKIIKHQERLLAPYVEKFDYKDGISSLFTVYGENRETFKLQVKNKKLDWADSNTTPIHHFKTYEDTFLSLLVGEITLERAINKRLVVVENVETQQTDLVEIFKWQEGFNRLYLTVRDILSL